MPKVTTYQRDTALQTVRGARASSVDPAAFGDFSGDAAMAQSLMDFSGQMNQLATKAAAGEAEEAALKFQQAKTDLMFNAETGFFNLKGKDAFNNAEAVKEQLDKLNQEYGQGLSGLARSAYDQAVAGDINRSQQEILRHANKQLDIWFVGQSEAKAETNLNQGWMYPDDEQQWGKALAVGATSLAEGMQLAGKSAEEIKLKTQEYVSKFHANRVTAKTETGSEAGKAVLDEAVKNGWIMAEDAVKLSKRIEVKAKAEETAVNAATYVNVAAGLVDEYQGNRAAAYEHIRKTYPDEEQRKKITAEFNTQYGNWLKGQAEIQSNLINDVSDFMGEVGVSINDYKIMYAEEWEKIEPKTQRLLEAKYKPDTVKPQTNPVEYNRLMSLPANELAKVDLIRHQVTMDKDDFKKLRDAVLDAQKGVVDRDSKAKSEYYNKTLEKVFKSKKEQTTAMDVIMELDENLKVEVDRITRLNKGEAPTVEQYQEAVNAVFGNAILEGKLYGTSTVGPKEVFNKLKDPMGDNPNVTYYDKAQELVQKFNLPMNTQNILGIGNAFKAMEGRTINKVPLWNVVISKMRKQNVPLTPANIVAVRKQLEDTKKNSRGTR